MASAAVSDEGALRMRPTPCGCTSALQIFGTIGAYVDALLFPQQGVLPSSLRGNCFRWERCLHAGGAVVQFCREFSVCWPQCSSTGSFCGTAAQSDPHSSASFCPLFLARQTEPNCKPAKRLQFGEDEQRNGRDLPPAAGRGMWSL